MEIDEKKLEQAEEFVMRWGHFTGSALKDIPNSYINWLATNCNDNYIAELADTIRQWRDLFNIEIEE